MKFEIENFGLLSTANIDIQKLNVITGKNNIVKSNLAKILYCFMAPASKDYEMITEYRIYKKLLRLLIKCEYHYDNKMEECHELLYDDENWKCLELLRKKLNEKEDKFEYGLDELDRIEKLFNENREEQYFNNLKFLLESEYCYWEGLMGNSEIKFYNGKDEKVLERNSEIMDGLQDFELEEVIYMNIEQNEIPYHNTHIRHKSYQYEPIDDDDIEEIAEKIWKIIENCNSCEVPSGVMQIKKIKNLLESGQLSKNSYLLLDNPENDLHPSLQVRLAEILVLMALKLNIKVYVNTNSPFLTEALEAYSKYHGIYDETNFYHVDENTEHYELTLLDDLSIAEIYKEYEEAFEMINHVKMKIDLGTDEGYF